MPVLFTRVCAFVTAEEFQLQGADYVILRLGSLDTYLPGKEFAHTWMSERADWFDLDADLARHEEWIEGA